MQIKSINKEDFDEIYSIWQKCGLHLSTCEWEKYEFEEMISLNKDSCFKLIIDNKIFGTVIGTYNGRRAWIYRLAVHPLHQNHNYGTQLLNKTLVSLKEKGATKVVIGVTFDNLKTVSFYEKNGFSVMNDAILLQKELRKK